MKLAIAIALLHASAAFAVNPSRELEPNDTPQTANYIAIASGPVAGRVSDFNDFDGFVFYSPGANITFTIGVAPSPIQASLSIGVYRASDFALLGGKEIPAGMAVTFSFAAPQGYYHLVMSRYLNTSPPASDYTINSTWDVVQSPVCPLDIDGNGKVDALTDGLMAIRILFGLTGTSVTNGAIGTGATRTTFDQIRTFLNANCGTVVIP